jgi:hypothetical protein
MNGDPAPNSQPMEVLIKKLENSDLITFHQVAKRLRDEEDILWRFNLLLDLGEFCLKAQAAFVLSLFRSRFISPQQKIDYEADVKGLKDATLGKWIGCIELWQNFPALALDSLFNAEFKKSADRLSVIRNRYAHAATPARSELVKMTEDLRGAVAGILNNFLNRALVFVIEPKPQSATSRPEWGRVYLEWDGRKTDLFPWFVAKIERDETVGIFAFNDFRKKDAPSFVDHGRGGQHASFSPAADTWILQRLNQMFEVHGPAMLFDEMIATRSDLIDPGSDYVTRTQSLKSIRRALSENKGKIVWLNGEAGMGKTGLVCQLIVELEQNFASEKPVVVLRHLCSRRVIGASSASAVKKNLCDQLRPHLPVDEPASELGDAITRYLASEQEELWVLIDGLDEMENAGEIKAIIREMAELAGGQSGQFLWLLIAGQPHLAPLFQSTVPDNYVTHTAVGMSVEEISLVAQKYEAWNRGWTDADNHQLAKKTGGLPLYVQSFLKEFSQRRKTREEIGSLPADLNDYWSGILDSALSSLSSDVELQEQTKRIDEILRSIRLTQPSLVPSCADLSAQVGDHLKRRFGRGEKALLLYVLACSPNPLDEQQLAQILDWEPKRVTQFLKACASFIRTVSSAVTLYHERVADFLLSCEEGSQLATKAESRLEAWLADWRGDDLKTSSWLPFITHCHRRAQSEENDSAKERSQRLVKTLVSLCEDWEFLHWILRSRKISELQATCLELMEDGSLQVLRSSFNLHPAPHHEDRRVLREGNIRLAEEADSHKRESETRESEYIDKEDEEELEILGGFTGEEVSESEIYDEEAELEEKERLHSPLPDYWFKGVFDTTNALQAIKRAYNATLEGIEAEVPIDQSAKALREFEAFLKSSRTALDEISALPDSSDKALAVCLVNSGMLKTSSLLVRARQLLAENTGPFVSRPNPNWKHHFYGEIIHRQLNHSFQFASMAPLLAYAAPRERRSPLPPTLVLWNWMENRVFRTLPFPGAKNVYLQALSGDGEQLIASVDSKMQLLRWDGSAKDLNVPEKSELVAVNPGFTHAIVGPNHYDYIDLVRNLRLCDPCTEKELIGARLTDCGAFCIYLSNRDFYLWTPIAEFQYRKVASRYVHLNYPQWNAKPTNFIISPNGRLFYVRGQLNELSSGKVFRRFSDVSAEASAAFSADSRILAILERDGELRVFNVQFGQLIAHVLCKSGADIYHTTPSLVFTMDGRFLMVRTDTEAFSVVDLCRSVSSDVIMETPSLSLDDELVPLPVAVGLREVAVSKQDRNTHNFIESFYDSIEWEVLQLDDAAIVKGTIDEEVDLLGKYSGTPLIDVEVLWVPRQGFVLDEVCKTTGKLLSRTHLIDRHPEIDWEEVILAPAWSAQSKNYDSEADTFSAHQIDWGMVCTRPDVADEVVGSAYPNILVHINLAERKINRIRNVGSFELKSEDFAISGNWMVLPNQIHDGLALWDLKEDSWQVFDKNTMPELFDRYRSQRGIPFEWLKRVAVIDWENRLIGWIDVSERKFHPTATAHNKLSALPSYSLKDTPLLVGVTAPRGDNFLNHFGLCLVDPFEERFFSHVYFEQEITNFVRISETRFCVIFKDGSVEEVAVDGA